MRKTYFAIAAGSMIAAVMTVFVAVQPFGSGGKPTEASSISRSAHVVECPMPPMKAAIAAGIDLYSVDDLLVDVDSFIIGTLPPPLHGVEPARSHSTESVEMASSELAAPYQAGEKGVSR